jgi:hypothetical protein
MVERCLLMTTDPGDLVLDPTCGSGTTAYVAEQWGRRWITIDTSRVALALARQRLLTASFPFYRVKDGTPSPQPSPIEGEGGVEVSSSLVPVLRSRATAKDGGGDKGEGEGLLLPKNPAKGFNYKSVPTSH